MCNVRALQTIFRIYVGGNFGEKQGRRSGQEIPAFHETVQQVVADSIPAATIYAGTGLWENQTERVSMIEIVGNKPTGDAVNILAEKLRDTLGQDAVMVTRYNAEVTFL
jgi:hypothetical protein